MKTAIITGGSGAIGAALAAEFSKDYCVVITYNNNRSAAESVAEKCGANTVQCDISKSSEIKKLEPFLSDCRLLINNAGISQIKLFTDITDEDWERMIGVNLSGVFYATRAVVPAMVRRKNGCIINISSVWGVYGASCEVHYSAVKAGVIGMTKALAKELGPSGISVNCIAPGVIDTPMNAHLSDDEMSELIECTPLGRLGSPDDIAHAARFLESSRFTTGQVLGIDGGFC